MNAPMLVDFQKDGATTKGLLKPARNGYLYWLKRDADGSIAYLRRQAYVPQNVFTSIDPGNRAARRRHGAQAGDRQVARSSAPACGAARTGRTRPTIPRPGLSTSRPTRTTATRSKAKSRSAFPGSGGPASPSRTCTSRSTPRRRSTARSRPATSIPASVFGGPCTRAR